jgi:hypothetical protein
MTGMLMCTSNLLVLSGSRGTEMTPKQQQRADLLERFAESDVVRLRKEAKALGMPTRFIKALDEMKAYAEHSRVELTLQTSKSGQRQA